MDLDNVSEPHTTELCSWILLLVTGETLHPLEIGAGAPWDLAPHKPDQIKCVDEMSQWQLRTSLLIQQCGTTKRTSNCWI